MTNTLTIAHKNTSATIEKGELTSFKVAGIEYMHQKESKGWGHTEIEMFPIIGPISKNNYRVHTKKGDAILDQHGLLRELDYTNITASKNNATFKKNYTKNTQLPNGKYPKKSTEKMVFWPYNFCFEKQFSITEKQLTITFILTSEKNMPFMLGFHPAFLLSNTGKEVVVSKIKTANLDAVYTAGHNALPFLNTDAVTLKHTNKPNITIQTTNFNNFMLWTPVDNMLCIEPITQYTSYTDEKFSEENMRLASGKDRFTVTFLVD